MKIIVALIFLIINLTAQHRYQIIVAQDGSGDYKTINEAVLSLPQFNYQRTIIFIKNGIYNERVKISQDYITLKGESCENTVIKYSLLRSDWENNKDAIGPGVINIDGDNVIIENLTVENTQPEIGPHAFAIYGFGTKIILLNSKFISRGADTVSLWDSKTGMYYYSGCEFIGAVDFVCPRGWCFIKDSKFFEMKATASVWHAGGEDKNQKMVLKNCSFDGVPGFELGRHHYDAAFYFISCKFSENMSKKEIYRVTYPAEPERDRPFNWGKRYYFYNSSKAGEQFDWLKDNLTKGTNKLKEKNITSAWTFNYKWDPEKTNSPKYKLLKINNDTLSLMIDEKVTVIGKPVLQYKNKVYEYLNGGGTNILKFILYKCNLTQKEKLKIRIPDDSSKIIVSEAGISERKLKIN